MTVEKTEVHKMLDAATAFGDQLVAHANGPADVGAALHVALLHWASITASDQDDAGERLVSALAALSAAA